MRRRALVWPIRSAGVAAAAAAARSLPLPFVLTARAENFLYGRVDLDDTIWRLQAFADAGADVLFHFAGEAASFADIDPFLAPGRSA